MKSVPIYETFYTWLKLFLLDNECKGIAFEKKSYFYLGIVVFWQYIMFFDFLVTRIY